MTEAESCLTARARPARFHIVVLRRDRDLVPDRKQGVARGDWIKGALIGFALALLVRLFVHWLLIFPLHMASSDMSPALPANQSTYFWHWFEHENLQRGDVVVLPHPDQPGLQLIRRIVALPGEQVQIHQGKLYIDNRPIEADWEQAAQSAQAAAGGHGAPIQGGAARRDFAGPVIVPDGQIYVLGDNRLRALDSRQLGPLPLASVSAVMWQ